MTAEKPPVAFLSYTRADDEHEGGRISFIRKQLEREVQFQAGNRRFIIFQDRIHIKWGENWRTRIAESLDEAMFLIPVITPSFFESNPCCEELDAFRAREGKLERRLVLPLYYQYCESFIILTSSHRTSMRRPSKPINIEIGEIFDLFPAKS